MGQARGNIGGGSRPGGGNTAAGGSRTTALAAGHNGGSSSSPSGSNGGGRTVLDSGQVGSRAHDISPSSPEGLTNRQMDAAAYKVQGNHDAAHNALNDPSWHY
jgi:hypothetical protein